MQVNEYQKAAMATLNPALDKKDVAWHLAEAAIALDIPLEAFFREIWTSYASVFPTGLMSGLRRIARRAICKYGILCCIFNINVL